MQTRGKGKVSREKVLPISLKTKKLKEGKTFSFRVVLYLVIRISIINSLC